MIRTVPSKSFLKFTIYQTNIGTIQVKVKGIHCASCASIIERTVKKIDGVSDVSVNNGTKKQKFHTTRALHLGIFSIKN